MNGRIEKIFVCLFVFLFCCSVQAQSVAAPKEISLTVSVTGERDKYVGGLKRENFQVTVDKTPQEIVSFDEQWRDAPATIVFLIDVSASQAGTITPFLKQIWQFIKRANPNNEYVLIAFNKDVELITDKTDDRKALADGLDRIAEIEPHGYTAFYKAMLAGIERAQAGKYQRKVLIACGDGSDNAFPKIKLRDVTESLKRSDVLLYSLSFRGEANDAYASVAEGRDILYKLTDIGGGRALFPAAFTEVAENFEQIAAELKNQYRITVRVGGDAATADKWRAVKVKAALAPGGDKKTKFDARTRSGFYPISAK